MNAEGKRRLAIRRDAALFDGLGIPRPPSGAAREGLTNVVRLDRDDGDDPIHACSLSEAAKRGKSLIARLPVWEGRFPRRPEHVPVRGIQPGFCCRCGRPSRTVNFEQHGEDPRDPYRVMQRAMDWCGKGRCDQEADEDPAVRGPATSDLDLFVVTENPDHAGDALPSVGPVAAPDSGEREAA